MVGAKNSLTKPPKYCVRFNRIIRAFAHFLQQRLHPPEHKDITRPPVQRQSGPDPLTSGFKRSVLLGHVIHKRPNAKRLDYITRRGAVIVIREQRHKVPLQRPGRPALLRALA